MRSDYFPDLALPQILGLNGPYGACSIEYINFNIRYIVIGVASLGPGVPAPPQIFFENKKYLASRSAVYDTEQSDIREKLFPQNFSQTFK